MNMKFLVVCLVLLCGIGCSETYTQQTVQGEFAGHGGQQLKLMGYRGFETYVIDSARADEKGNFVLRFGEADYGMGSLQAADGKAFVVILAPDEGLKLTGESISMPQTVQILSGKQNQYFEQYASEHIRREQARSAWDYLARIYQQDSLFAVNRVPRQAIEAEIARIKEEDDRFLKGLDADTYVHWFLPVRKLVSSVSTVAQYRTEEIPETLAAFRAMDYTDERLYKSGLLGDAIEAHFWLIENSGRSLDSVYVEMNYSIDLMLENLAGDEEKFNAITDYLFKLLERRSLFTSSEYLAVKVLNEVSCTLDEKLASQLESYRAMKKGNTAPDFALGPEVLAPEYEGKPLPAMLTEIAADYYLVVFGASWCPACPEELSQLSALYGKWKQYGVEVVFVSLDEEQQAFKNFAGEFPFISTCDYQKWDSPVVTAYHVFATPTMYLLDKNREILLRPNSVSHMDSWVEWFLGREK
jgi:thiol-disulfide isomerase/thioredoxin